MSDASDTSACPCDALCHPRAPYNPAGLSTLAYRVGDYAAFREALLRPRGGEAALTAWRPGAQGDLAVQAVEWWAYLADVLTFYNQRAANQAYLRTADLDESVSRLIQVLGYRPRPGLGARGTVAASTSSPVPITLPAAFPVASKPAPGQDPQLFELDADTVVQPGGAVAAAAAPGPILSGPDAKGVSSVLLKGVVNTVKAGDSLLLLRGDWPATAGAYALASVQSVQTEAAPDGKKNTRVRMTLDRALPASAASPPPGYRLQKSTQTVHPWHDASGKAPVFATSRTRIHLGRVRGRPTFAGSLTRVHLEALERTLQVGDAVLFQAAAGAGLTDTVVSVTNYQEVVWYANPKSSNDPSVPPDNPPNVPVPIPHSVIDVSPQLSGNWNGNAGSVLLRYAWQDVGEPIGTPATSVSASDPPLTLAVPLPVKANATVLVQDATGAGAPATAADASTVRLNDAAAALTPPLQVLVNLLAVSRGQTVRHEVLGSGDASLPGQEFVLQKKPVTYLADQASLSGDGYSSTVRVWVNGIEWHEVPNFYGRAAGAHVFVTREDEQGQTRVQFLQLPSGVNNVVADYRYGSGAAVPPAGTLSVLTRPFPGLSSVNNPVPPAGGSDPDPSARVRTYAPRSVLTFGRAVSADDYEAIAAQAPGVARTRSYWSWDADAQRTMTTIYVGDDAGALTSAAAAIAAAADPNRPVKVLLAAAVAVGLRLAVRHDPDYPPDPLVRAVRAALLDPDAGLFGTNVVRIGGSVFESQIFAACLQVPGALAVTSLEFEVWFGETVILSRAYRHDPGEGSFFRLADDALEVTAHVG
jgi:hypothetical protein